jgi:hypothetical protein
MPLVVVQEVRRQPALRPAEDRRNWVEKTGYHPKTVGGRS